MTVISISGLSCCGSSTIGKILSEKLNLKLFSLGKKFKEYGDGNETEKAINVWNSDKGNKKDFHENLDEMQINLAKEGNIVIDSKLAIHFLDNIADLRIWLTAPFEIRAERAAKREKCSINEARKMLEQKENLEKEMFMKVYGINYLEQKEKANIIIDVSKANPEEAAEKIISILKVNKL